MSKGTRVETNKVKLLQLPILILLSATITFGQSNSWNGVTPLKSTRADVEKILVKSDRDSKAKDAASYTTDSERVFILYSTGFCNVNPNNGWNMPKGIVLYISVKPKIRPKFDESKLNASEYDKDPDPEMLDFIHYRNEKKGNSIQVDIGDIDGPVIESFYYYPESKFDYLKCSAKP